jgi:hypothetical protein
MRTYSKGGKLIGNGGRSLLDVLGVDVAGKHGSRHGRRDSVELHGGRSDEIARENEFQTSLTELRGWRGRKRKETRSRDVQLLKRITVDEGIPSARADYRNPRVR